MIALLGILISIAASWILATKIKGNVVEKTASMQEIASSSHALANMAENLQRSIRKFSV